MVPTKNILLSATWLSVFLAFFSPRAVSQACSGTILFEENFGGDASSPDLGAPLPGSVTTYNFTNEVVDDGFYGIRKSVPANFQSWLQGTDHTGGGYMMIVNASYTAGLFYESRIEGLCQGSSFYFSAWLANLLKASASDPLDPNLKFVIRKASDSTVIDSLETGTLPRFSTLTWKQYGIHFDLPAGESSVILQIFNHQTGGSGNDLALDDISFSLCGPAIGLSESGIYQHSFDACQGDHVRIEAAVESGFYHQPRYQWQFSTDSLHWEDIAGQTATQLDLSSVTAADSGWYRILTAEKGNISSENCRSASAPIPLNVFGVPSLELRSNSPVCEGSDLKLDAPEGLVYAWEGPSGFQSSGQHLDFPSAVLADEGRYTLTLTSRGGCVSRLAQNVSVQPNDLKVSLGTDSLLCEGSAITLDVTNPGAVYHWNTGQQLSTIRIDTGGYYQVTVTKGYCSMSDSLHIREVKKPQADLGSDTTICYGMPYQLNATFPDAETYLWQDGTMQPVFDVKTAGTYSVLVTNSCGAATSTVAIKTEECADHLIFPTAFTPNGDGQNDFFRPRVVLQVRDYHLKVMDRWGRNVFQTNNPSTAWNGVSRGSRVPVGTYVWIASYLRTKDNKQVLQKGTITLLR